MAVTRAKKTQQVEKLSRDLQNVSNVVVATYTKMTVAQDYELRKALRGAGAKYQVVKNTLAERAAKGTKVEDGLKDLKGVTSIAYTEGDPVALAKRPVPPSPEDLARMLKPEDLGRTIRFVAEMPSHVCINEILISPSWNRSFIGGADLARR